MEIDETLPASPPDERIAVPSPPLIDAEELQDRCFTLVQQHLHRREFAGRLAELIAEAGGSTAVAILSYHRRRHRLSLLGSLALADEARAALEGGAQYSWDIPIRGLRNRRISVIEAAHRNPFVPSGLLCVSPGDLAIACIPVYHESLPTAVVLLFNSSDHVFRDADLHAIAGGLRIAARGLRDGAELQEPGEGADEAHEGAEETHTALDIQRAETFAEADAEELGQLRRSLGALQEQRDALAARLERAEEELQRARLEVERSVQTARTLTSSRQAVVQERDRLKSDLADLERAQESVVAQLRTDVSSLEDRLLVAESDRLRYQRAADQLRSSREQAVLALERERDSLLDRVRTAEAGTAAVQGALSAVREDRDRLAAHIDVLTRQIETGRSALQDERDEHQRRLDALQAEHADWQEQLATLQSEVALRADQQGSLERELRTALAARDASADQLQAVHAELARLSDFHGGALERAEQAEAGKAAALAEAEALRESLAGERAERERGEHGLRAEIEAAEAAVRRAAETSSALQERTGELQRLVAERDAQIAHLEHERQVAGQDAVTFERAQAGRESEAQRRVEELSGERDGLVQRVQQAEQALATESERVQAEARRATNFKERIDKFQESLAQADATRTTMSAQLAQAQAELEALRGQSADRGLLARQLTELSSKVIEHEKMLEAARDEAEQATARLAEAERQRAALAKGLQTAHREREQSAVALERDHERLRESLAEAEAQRRQIDAEKAELVESMREQRTTHAAAFAEMQATIEQLRAERERAVSERDQHAGRITAAQVEADARATQALQDSQGMGRRLGERERRLDELTDHLRQRDTALEQAAAERRELSAALQAAETAMLDLQREVESVRETFEQERRDAAEATERLERTHRQELQVAQRVAEERENRARQASMLALEERRAARYDAPLIIERSDAKGTVVETTAAPHPSALSRAGGYEAVQQVREKLGEGATIILDRGALCEDAVAVLKAAGVEASGAEPTEASIDAFAGRTLGAILLNVAAGPPMWELVRKLRDRPATKNVPILAYLMDPEAANGFCFGRCDFGLWPNDLSHLVETLKRMRPMVRRVLVASSDVEALGQVREPLAKAHISASNVLDGKQARELGHSLQPEAAVLHFSPTCSDIARALASYRQLEATRDLPLLLMLDKSGSARESIFFQAASRELLRTGRFDFSQLPEELLRLKTPK